MIWKALRLLLLMMLLLMLLMPLPHAGRLGLGR